MSKYIWMNGMLKKWDNAKIHVMTHSFHYGCAAFEGIRFYHTKNGTVIFRLQDHIERLFNSAKTLSMKPTYSKNQIIDGIKKTVRYNGFKWGYIRPMIYYGYGDMRVDPGGCHTDTIIAVWQWKVPENKPLKIKISTYLRLHPLSTNIAAKISGNYVNSVLGLLEAKKEGYDESLTLDYKGYVAEGSGENIFMVKHNNLITPKLGNILPGITRSSIIEIARDSSIKVIEKNITLKELLKADEVFLTGTASEIIGVAQIERTAISTTEGKLTKKLRDVFRTIIKGEHRKYKKWLSYI